MLDYSKKENSSENYEEIEFLVLVYLKENKYQKTFENFMKECSKFTLNLFYSFFQPPINDNHNFRNENGNEFNYIYQMNKKKLKSLNYIISDYSSLKKQALQRSSFYSQLISPNPTSPPYIFSPNPSENFVLANNEVNQSSHNNSNYNHINNKKCQLSSIDTKDRSEIGKIGKTNSSRLNSNMNSKLSTEKIDNTMKKLVDMIDDLYYYRTNFLNNQEDQSNNTNNNINNNNLNGMNNNLNQNNYAQSNTSNNSYVNSIMKNSKNSNIINNNNNNNSNINNNNNNNNHTNTNNNNAIQVSFNEQKPNISFDFTNLTPTRTNPSKRKGTPKRRRISDGNGDSIIVQRLTSEINKMMRDKNDFRTPPSSPSAQNNNNNISHISPIDNHSFNFNSSNSNYLNNSSNASVNSPFECDKLIASLTSGNDFEFENLFKDFDDILDFEIVRSTPKTTPTKRRISASNLSLNSSFNDSFNNSTDSISEGPRLKRQKLCFDDQLDPQIDNNNIDNNKNSNCSVDNNMNNTIDDANKISHQMENDLNSINPQIIDVEAFLSTLNYAKQ